MSWSHLLIEGYCLFDKDKDEKIPDCCDNGPDNIGLNCLLKKEYKNSMCPFFGYKKTRSTIAITDGEGHVINFDSFESDDIDENKWIEGETRWIKKCSNIIDNI